MGKIFKLEIAEPPHGAHISEVKGTVVLKTKKDKKYKTIKVTVQGVANTDWSETVGTGEERRTVDYSDKRECAKNTVVLWSNDDAPDNCLQEGDYEFPFSLSLKGEVPSTFDGERGHIRYEVTAIIVKSKLNKNKVVSKKIRVHELLDLNTLPGVKEPVIKQDEKTLCCLCCASGPISLTARIPRSGFFCGKDKIPLEVEVENGSSRPIEHVSAKLKKEVTFIGHNRETSLHNSESEVRQAPHRSVQRRVDTIAEAASDPVAPGSSLSWSPETLLVPKTDPTIANCTIISVKYFLKVEAAISFALDAGVTFPLTLGTVPLND